MTTWIISADAGRARIFSDTDPNSPLQEIDDLIDPAARERISDQLTDRLSPLAASNSQKSTGDSLPTSQYQPAKTQEQHNAELFARDICAQLLKAKNENRFDRLALVAAPAFLGELRNQLDPQLKQLVSYEIDKDYAHSNGAQLRDQIRAYQAKKQA